jgi:hypothetical protein
MVSFSGMEPWHEDYDIIEVHARGQLLDLHNFGTVLGAEYRPPDVLVFRFELDEPPWRLELQFLTAHDLGIERTDLSTHDPNQLHGISYEEKDSEGDFRVILGDGLMFEFKAKDVVAVVDEGPTTT